MAVLVLRIDTEQWIEALKRRGPGIALALLVEGLLALLLLTMAPQFVREEVPVMEVFGISAEREDAAETETPAEAASASASETAAAEEAVRPEPPTPAQPTRASPVRVPTPSVPDAPAPPTMIQISPEDMAAADITPRRTPAPSGGRTMGPIDPGGRPGFADTPRVPGSGPNGEPLYAASWYREPYESELSGYLSTAQGPGWGMIICRTVQGYRVEDCEIVGESPQGSGIARAVLAAAWQFRVRPPRIGGQQRFGEWVRIRITYGNGGVSL